MNEKPKYYLTTPIYYPNARPHVGSAYTTIVCDVLARYKRMCGYDVAFLTGTDEHGEKLERAASAAGLSPRQFVAEKRKLFVKLWEKLGISDHDFVYTDHADHEESVQWMLRRARDAGYIDKKHYQGRYCVFDEMYVSEGSEPVNCPNCDRPTELISEDNYFFKLSAFEERLLDLYEKHPEFVRPDFRLNEVKSFVKSGLRDISVSRKRIKWGIPWPPEDDPDQEQVVYVWYDALTSYLTGIGFKGEERSQKFNGYWPADLHMIGKDILRFHAVYWPAFLMAARLPLPKTVFAHGWIYYEQDKMSKSKGNVVYPEPIVDALDSFGAPGNDALRYYLLREAPFGQDTSFSYEGLIQRYNSDLANDWGNLANRTITMINRYHDGVVPPSVPERFDQDEPIMESARKHAANCRDFFDQYEFSRALDQWWEFIGEVNKYLVVNEPWAIVAAQGLVGPPEVADLTRHRRDAVLYTAAEAVRLSAVILYSILPRSAEALWKQLGCEEYLGKIKAQRVDQLKWGGLKPGTKVGKPEPIFPAFRNERKEALLARLYEIVEADRERDKPKEASKPVESQPPQAPTSGSPAPAVAPQATAKITIDDFAKVELRVGEVLSAEPVPGAQRLLNLMVDIGSEVRQVVAGIAEHYTPEQLVGMKVVLVANLQPRKMRGVESNGMILAASVGEEGKPVLATFKEDVPKGSKLR